MTMVLKCAAVGVNISRALIGALMLTSGPLFDNSEISARWEGVLFSSRFCVYSHTPKEDLICFGRKRYDTFDGHDKVTILAVV